MKGNTGLFSVVRRWAERKGVTPVQFSLGWLLAQKPFIVPIPGTTDPAHLAENLGGAAVTFTSDELTQIEADLSKAPVVGPRYGGPSQDGVEARPKR